jgi:hypothetical protein
VKKLENMDRNQLTWAAPKLGPNWYELHAGDKVVGTLRWEKNYQGPAVVVAADGYWTFELTGPRRPVV